VLGLGGKLVAYVGGVEYNEDRLRTISGQPGTPLFDTSVRLEGAGAWVASETFVQRWKAHPDNQPDPRPALRADGLHIPPSSGGTLAVQMTHTYGDGYPYPLAVHTAGKALANAISKARQFIYVEDQYFVGSDEMKKAFFDVLSKNTGLFAIVAIAPDDSVTDTPDLAYRRREFVRPLVAAFPGRFLVFERLGDNGSATGPSAYIHSKLLIVDDEALLIGSVNSNRRSWSHDTEVDVTIVDSKGPGSTQAGSRGWVRDFRCMLWSRHLRRDIRSLGDPAVDLRIWRDIANGTATGAQVRPFDVSANPPRWGGLPLRLVAGLSTDVLLWAIWNAFVDPD
jgi:phosphatidylserine/phosphatidylglycerophosphate/cardiolipin synthase-like enzyme